MSAIVSESATYPRISQLQMSAPSSPGTERSSLRMRPPAVPDLFFLCVFDSFVESGKFEAFHVRPCPRPPSTSATSAPTPVAGRTGLYVPVTRRPPLPPQAVAVFSSASFAASFFHSFHGKKWPAHLPGSTPNTPNTGRCVVDRVVASSSGVFAASKRRDMRGKTSRCSKGR